MTTNKTLLLPVLTKCCSNAFIPSAVVAVLRAIVPVLLAKASRSGVCNGGCTNGGNCLRKVSHQMRLLVYLA